VSGAVDLERLLARHRLVAVDTSPFIYHLDAHPAYERLTTALFRWVEGRSGRAVTSTLTMTELLVQPMRREQAALVNTIFALGATYPHLDWIAPTLAIAERAARVRARHGLRTPDAIQAATALESGATLLVTNDTAFRRVGDLEVAVLDDLLGTR
jgi:predicted nucleic acid-binding protein